MPAGKIILRKRDRMGKTWYDKGKPFSGPGRPYFEIEVFILMEIRAAVPEDIPSLLALYKGLFAEAAQIQPYNFRPAEQSEEFLKQVMADPSSALLTAVSEGKPVGFALLRELRTPSAPCLTPHRFAALEDLAVAPELRGVGVGSSLLDAAKDWARSRGLDYLELNVLAENTQAKRLYERNGFESAVCKLQCHL